MLSAGFQLPMVMPIATVWVGDKHAVEMVPQCFIMATRYHHSISLHPGCSCQASEIQARVHGMGCLPRSHFGELTLLLLLLPPLPPQPAQAWPFRLGLCGGGLPGMRNTKAVMHDQGLLSSSDVGASAWTLWLSAVAKATKN